METHLDKLVNEMELAFPRRMDEAVAELVLQGKLDHAERLAIAAKSHACRHKQLWHWRDLFHAPLVL